MNEEVKRLRDERIKLYEDHYNNIIPKRMPVSISLPTRVVAEYSGVDTIDYQYDFSKLADGQRELAAKIYTDTSPFGPSGSIISRLPGFYQLLDAQSFVMGNNGFVQHPEVVGMTEDEYPYLIEDPLACMLERVIPRQYKGFEVDCAPVTLNKILMANEVLTNAFQQSIPCVAELMEKYGYYPGAPAGSGAFSAAPYDFIADQLRSFSGISSDIRRRRSELIEACESVLPLVFYWGIPANIHPTLSRCGTPLHMPTYMREKDFAEVWLPTYKRQTEQWAALGVRTGPFCEHDWMRYMDLLLELPAGTQLMFEYGDPKIIKEKLGKKFLLTGLYPINLIKTGTKQQVIDKAKEMLDILLPGGGYLFGFDKGALHLGDINLENIFALSEFLRDYAVYDNPGQPYGTKLNSEGFVFSEEIIPRPKSKYLFDWEEFKAKYPVVPEFARKDFERFQNKALNLYMNMLV